MNRNDILNKLIIHPSFNSTVEDLNKKSIRVPKKAVIQELDYYNYVYPPNGKLLTVIDEIEKISLDPKVGQELANGDRPIMAYDESINRFSSLEGDAFLASHSLVINADEGYVPSNKITLYFYTRSKNICEGTQYIKHSVNPQSDSKKDFVLDKINFMKDCTVSNSILLIDGPLIGGDWYIHMIQAINEFLEKDVIPIFFVKNSNSNLVTDEIVEFKNRFNSDMHWSFNYLKPGERTNFFRYVDRGNEKNAKIFCYLKPFNVSPQRVEFHVDTFNKYRKKIPELMDLIYYLILVQGNARDPQVRPIAIAEAYARETIKLFNLQSLMKDVGIIPTINQERFAW